MDIGFYKNYFKVEKEHWLMVGRRLIARDNLAKYGAKKAREIKVLDFGCGSGLCVDELAKVGYDSYGLDISEDAVNFGKAQGIKHLGIIEGQEINFPDATFEAVCTLDVLEHLEDERWALAEIERVLKPDGVVVIMVPAYMFLWGIQDETSHHYRRYTKGAFLKKIKQSTTLSVVRASYFNTFLFLPITLVRFASRFLRIKARESDFDINSPFLNKMFSTIFGVERKLLTYISFPFGVSILVVLKKSGSSVG